MKIIIKKKFSSISDLVSDICNNYSNIIITDGELETSWSISIDPKKSLKGIASTKNNYDYILSLSR